MDIVTFLNSIIANLGSPAPNFVVGSKAWQNLVADNETLPIIFLDEPITSNDNLKISKVIEENYKLIFLFLNKSEIDFTPSQHGEICQAMRDLRADFIYALENSQLVKNISNVTTKNIMNIFDSNLSGVLVTLDLVLFNTSSVC